MPRNAEFIVENLLEHIGNYAQVTQYLPEKIHSSKQIDFEYAFNTLNSVHNDFFHENRWRRLVDKNAGLKFDSAAERSSKWLLKH